MRIGLFCRAVPRSYASLLQSRRGFAVASNVPSSPSTTSGVKSSLGAVEHVNAGVILGLALSKTHCGYAILKADTLQALKFGVVDNSNGSDVHEKVQAVMKTYRNLRADFCDMPSHEDGSSNMFVGVKDTTLSVTLPSVRTKTACVEVSTLNALMVSELIRANGGKRPHAVVPRAARHFIGLTEKSQKGIQASVFECAKAQVPNFPEIKTRNGIFDPVTYMMSDAWSCAMYTQRLAEVEARLANPAFARKIRGEIMLTKPIARLQEALDLCRSPSMQREMLEVLESRIKHAVGQRVHRLLEQQRKGGEMVAPTLAN